MKKNKKAVVSLKVLVGVIFSVTLIILTVNIFYKFARLNDSSKDSFYELIRMIEDANKNNDEAKLESMNLRMDKDTIILGFSKEEKLAHITKPLKYGCEENNECICLLRDFDKTKLFAGKISGKVICEVIENLEFTNVFPENDPSHKYNGGICISRSPSLLLGIRTSVESNNRQFRTVYAHKYNGTVAVCEFLNEKKNSCIPVEYLNEDKAFEGMKKLAEFIESCKDREFVNTENPEPCSCGAFDFRYFILEEYDVEFTESDEGKLKLILKHEGKKDPIKTPIEVDMPLCTYQPMLNLNQDYLPKDESIILNYNLPPYYTFYYKEDSEDKRIVFVKNSDENICILRASDRGYIGLDAESPDTVTFEKTLKTGRQGITSGHPEINISGCGLFYNR